MNAFFKHDCPDCEFIGQVELSGIKTPVEKDLKLDLYTCDKGSWKTYITRYGDKGSEYLSTPAMILKQHLDKVPKEIEHGLLLMSMYKWHSGLEEE